MGNLDEQELIDRRIPGSMLPYRDWDGSRTEPAADLLQAGFELAHFLVPNRLRAIQILSRALEKVHVCSRRELKRLYWRDKNNGKPIRRIARNDIDLLQWLIMFESEQDEKEQEKWGDVTSQSMLIRYIKHLIRTTSMLSSFYVNVAITRLLHRYTTGEAQRVYEALTSRFLGEDEYRRAKSAVMEKLIDRFSPYLRRSRGEHGEFRFEPCSNQNQWSSLVTLSLQMFTPWSTQSVCPRSRDPNGQVSSHLYLNASDRNDAELQCCHILIEPTCFNQLTEDLALASPETKLAVPQFYMSDNQQNGDRVTEERRFTTPLSQQEIDEIQRQTRNNDVRRQSLIPQSLTIAIDGTEQLNLDLLHDSAWRIGLEPGANLLEVRSRDDVGPLVLATHVIPNGNDAPEVSELKLRIDGGTLRLTVTPVARFEGLPMGVLDIHHSPRLRRSPFHFVLQLVRDIKRSVPLYARTAFLVLLLTLGAVSLFFVRKSMVLQHNLQQANDQLNLQAPANSSRLASYLLVPDAQRVRGADASSFPAIPLHGDLQAIVLILPISQGVDKTYSAELKTFSDDEILLTQQSLHADSGQSGPVLRLVIPASLLRRDTYYTVILRTAEGEQPYSFKVTADQ